MSAHEFWYEDVRLFECYLNAYNNRVNKFAWANGMYAFEAVSTAINNVGPVAVGYGFNGKKLKTLKYHEKPIDLYKKPEENLDPGDYAFNKWVHNFRKLKGGEGNA